MPKHGSQKSASDWKRAWWQTQQAPQRSTSNPPPNPAERFVDHTRKSRPLRDVPRG